MGVNVSVLFANDDARKDCHPDAAAVADCAVVVLGLWNSGSGDVAGRARLSNWHVDGREEGFDSGSNSLAEAAVTPRSFAPALKSDLSRTHE